MVSVFDFDDYKVYLRAWIAARPKGGRGESRRLAAKLSLSTTLVSQVLSGDKHFTMEAASDLCDHLGLSDSEADQLLLLVDHARAGSVRLKQRIFKKIAANRANAQKLSVRLEKDRSLSETESAVFYSHWVYTGITHLIACDPHITTDEIAQRLQLPLHMVSKAMNFLLESGLLIQRGGALEIGAKKTHLGSDSPLVVKHHQNWRIQAFSKMSYTRENDLFYSAPMSLSREVAKQIRADLPTYIEKIVKWVGPSPSEVVRCLNIDWFDYENS